MYPRISDFFNDIFGTDWVWPIQSFGFFVALGFMIGFWVVRYDLRLKEKAGIFPVKKVKVKEGGPIPMRDVLLSFLFWGIAGYKLGLMFEDYGTFVQNPQAALLSSKGSVLWMVVAAVAGGGFRYYQYQQRKESKETEIDGRWGIIEELGPIFTLAFVLGILGAKMFHIFEYWGDFMKDPQGMLFSFSGLTFYGGLILAAIGIAWYINKKGYRVLPFADSAAPVMMGTYGVGRMGCQTAGDGDWGIVNNAPKPDWLSWAPDWMWASNYPHNVLRDGVPIPGCTGDYCNQLAEPVFPTPFYEVIMALSLFAILWLIRKRLPYWGQLSGIYLVFNGFERFWIEKIRVNAKMNFLGMEVTQAEIISSILMILGVVLFLLATFKWKQKATWEPMEEKSDKKKTDKKKSEAR